MRNRGPIHDVSDSSSSAYIPSTMSSNSTSSILNRLNPIFLYSYLRNHKKEKDATILSENLAISQADSSELDRAMPKSFRVIGVEIGSCSPTLQYVFCTAGVMIFLLLYGFLQELVVMNKFKRSLGWFVTLLQLSGYAICAWIQSMLLGGGFERRIPLRLYFVLSVLQVVMQGLTNLSMHYLNYPAKTLFKSSRVVMTMLFGVIFLGRRYSQADHIIALSMVVGLTTFVAADAHSSPEFDLTGVGLVMLALAADAATLNLQEHCLHTFAAGHDELVYYSNVGAAVVALLMSIASGRESSVHEADRYLPRLIRTIPSLSSFLPCRRARVWNSISQGHRKFPGLLFIHELLMCGIPRSVMLSCTYEAIRSRYICHHLRRTQRLDFDVVVCSISRAQDADVVAYQWCPHIYGRIAQQEHISEGRWKQCQLRLPSRKQASPPSPSSCDTNERRVYQANSVARTCSRSCSRIKLRRSGCVAIYWYEDRPARGRTQYPGDERGRGAPHRALQDFFIVLGGRALWEWEKRNRFTSFG